MVAVSLVYHYLSKSLALTLITQPITKENTGPKGCSRMHWCIIFTVYYNWLKSIKHRSKCPGSTVSFLAGCTICCLSFLYCVYSYISSSPLIISNVQKRMKRIFALVQSCSNYTSIKVSSHVIGCD